MTDPRPIPAAPSAAPDGAAPDGSSEVEQTGTPATDAAPTATDAAPTATDVAPTATDADGRTRHPAGEPGSSGTESLEREGEIAADYLEELLDIADLDGDIDMDVERDRALVSVVGGDLDHLVGKDGVVLEALQELTRLAVLTRAGQRSRLMLDVAGYRAGRRAVLAQLGASTAEQVRTSGQPARLAPMSPFERKVVHDAVAAAGLRSESEGEEPERRVVVLPA